MNYTRFRGWVKLWKDDSAKFLKSGLIPKYQFHTEDLWAETRLSSKDFNSLVAHQKGTPVKVMKIGNRNWWMFHDQFYFEDEGYSPAKVSAFVNQDLDEALQPEKLADFIGQEHVTKNLAIMIEAAKYRNEPLEHVLLWGEEGSGRSALVFTIASELGVSVHRVSAGNIKKQADLGAILTNLTMRQLLLFEGVDKLNPKIRPVFFRAIDEFAFDILIGKGISARSLRLKLPRFTVLATANDREKIPTKFRHAFGAEHHLGPYSPAELRQLLQRAAEVLQFEIQEASALKTAAASNGFPYDAIRLLRWVRDYALVKADGKLTEPVVEEALSTFFG